MKLRLTKRAVRDLDGISEFIAQHSPAAAKRVRGSILKSVETLALFPHVGHRQNISGVRKLVTRKYSYLVYYVVEEASSEVHVLTVQHASRQREFSDL
jgi:plasmid stabilization system protein ParE